MNTDTLVAQLKSLKLFINRNTLLHPKFIFNPNVQKYPFICFLLFPWHFIDSVSYVWGNGKGILFALSNWLFTCGTQDR